MRHCASVKISLRHRGLDSRRWPRNARSVLSLAGSFHPFIRWQGSEYHLLCAVRAIPFVNGQLSASFIYLCCRIYVRLQNGLFIAFSQSDFRDCARLPTLLTHMKNVDELRSKLNETQSNTRNRINVTKRLIDRSFLQLRESHRLLYAADRSTELLAAMFRVNELSRQ